VNEDIAKWLAAFEGKVLRRMSGGITVNENWRKRYSEDLLRLFGDLEIIPLVGISRLNWIGHLNGMDSTRKVSQAFNNNPQGSRLRGRPSKRWRNCVRTDIKKYKTKNWK
jgi:hypothetical protein